jgi:hypothetical protein
MITIHGWHRRVRDAIGWLICWSVTTAVVAIGAMFGDALVINASTPVPFVDSLARIDGLNYKRIATEGYQYEPEVPSFVAFFPAFPLGARWLSELTGLNAIEAELVISNTCCCAAFGIMWAYLRRRPVHCANDSRVLPGKISNDVCDYVLLSMGLVPTTFFFRMAYTESMFLCLALLSLYAISRQWPAVIVALVIGLATAVRPVGACLLLPLCAYIWRRSSSSFQAARQAAIFVPLGCWGLLAYMTYLAFRFHQPLAFAMTQRYHRVRPIGSVSDQVLSLISWEPIRDVYDRSSPGFWQALHYAPNRLFSLEFANPIYLLGTAVLVSLGAWKRWLTRDEVLLAIPLIIVPYFTRAYEMRMLSQARFAAVVFPAYIVIGELLARLPRIVAVSLLALSGLMMGIYAALFAAGYPFL